MALSRSRQAFNFFRQKGLSDAQAAGFVGNLMQESGPSLDPTASGDNGSAFGIGQWRMDRRTALERKAEERGVDPSNFQLQLEHAWDEMIGPERQAFDQLIRAENPEDAAITAQNAFFRPNPDLAHTDRRVSFATELLSGGNNQSAQGPRGPMGARTFGQSSAGQNMSTGPMNLREPNPRETQIAGGHPMANGNQQQQQLLGLLEEDSQQQEGPGGIQGLLGNPLFTGGLGLLAAAPDVRRGNMTAFEALSGAANLGTGMASQMQDIRSQRQDMRSSNRIDQLLASNPEALGLNPQQAATIRALPTERKQQVLANIAAQGERQTSLQRNMEAAGIDPRSKQGREIVLNNVQGGNAMEQLDIMESRLNIMEKQRELQNEQRTQEQSLTDAQNAASSLRRNLIEMAEINNRLEDTAARPGSGYQDIAATALAAGGATGLAETFGFSNEEASRIASDFERLNQLATNLIVTDIETMRGSGRVTNTLLETMLETKPGTGVQPGTNRRRIADLLEGAHTLFGQLDMEGMGEFIEQDQELLNQWRGVGQQGQPGQGGSLLDDDDASGQPGQSAQPGQSQGGEESDIPNFQDYTDEELNRFLGR